MGSISIMRLSMDGEFVRVRPEMGCRVAKADEARNCLNRAWWRCSSNAVCMLTTMTTIEYTVLLLIPQVCL